MKIGILNTGVRHEIVDFATGETNNNIDMPKLSKVQQILDLYPYPGDLEMDSIDWVTDTALAVENFYKPDFMFLSYATPYFLALFQPEQQLDWDAIKKRLFAQIERFISETGYTPVILGTGGTQPIEAEVDLTGLEGVVTCSRMGPVYAGLYNPTQRDLEYLEQLETVQMVLPQERLVHVWSGGSDSKIRIPDYLLVASRGYVFRSLVNTKRVLHRVNARDNIIPVECPDQVNSIGDIAAMVKKRLRKERVALIIAEGIDVEDFYFASHQCSNNYSWYTYLPGEGQYLVTGSGKHLPEHPYPPGYRYYEDNEAGKAYPFSGYYHFLPDAMVGSPVSIRSAAVGTRSIMTHVASGADLCIECYTRSLQRYGSLAIVDSNAWRPRRRRRK